ALARAAGFGPAARRPGFGRSTATMTTAPPAADAPAPAPPRPPPASILVVDDVPLNRELLSRRLKPQGHAVTSAEHGREAMDKLRAAAPGSGFDLVLLDIMMPEM